MKKVSLATFYLITITLLLLVGTASAVSVETPTAAFTADITTGPAPLTVQFTDTSAGGPSSRSWDFGDGGTSTEEDPAHVYSSAGTYTVSLTVTNSQGSDTETRSDYITIIPPPPEADFSGTPISGAAPLTVSFTDTSTGSPTGWAWFFGDETYGEAWTNQTGDAGWPARYSHTSVAMPDGSIVLMGGQDESGLLNDTWRSTDGGATWTNITPQDPGDLWTARYTHTSVALPDGSIVLMGGYDGSTGFNDTWRSTDGGATWTDITPQDPGDLWTARFGHTSVAMPDGSIVLMGGWDSLGRLNDTWRSTDGGATWTQLPDAGWTQRVAHTSVALPDGSIVLMGGVDGGVGSRNDVWRSTDGGATWTRQTEHAGWTARQMHTSVALPDGSIVLMGGYSNWIPLNDVWRSTDGGATWTNITPQDPGDLWTGRWDHTSVALPDGSIIITGGNDGTDNLKDTWQLQPAGSSAQNPVHTYETPGIYSVTLLASNAAGYDTAEATGYITVTAPTPTPTPGPAYSSGGGGSTGGPEYNVGGDSAVSMVNVTGTGIEMLIVTGWKQSSPGSGIPPAPPIVYQYVDLVPARFTEITGANITFTIPVAWLEEHGFTPEEIVLYHYNGTAWEALPTWIVDATGTSVTFTATTPGFSLFAISGVEQVEEAVTTPTAAATTSRAVAEPTATETAAAPAGGAAPEFPLGTIAIVGGAVLLLAAGGFLVRRWWIRRQNPALFRDYD